MKSQDLGQGDIASAIKGKTTAYLSSLYSKFYSYVGNTDSSVYSLEDQQKVSALNRILNHESKQERNVDELLKHVEAIVDSLSKREPN